MLDGVQAITTHWFSYLGDVVIRFGMIKILDFATKSYK